MMYMHMHVNWNSLYVLLWGQHAHMAVPLIWMASKIQKKLFLHLSVQHATCLSKFNDVALPCIAFVCTIKTIDWHTQHHYTCAYTHPHTHTHERSIQHVAPDKQCCWYHRLLQYLRNDQVKHFNTTSHNSAVCIHFNTQQLHVPSNTQSCTRIESWHEAIGTIMETIL